MPPYPAVVLDRLPARLPSWLRGPTEILIAAGREYGDDRAGRMAAAIAYRTVFTLAPLLVIAVWVVGVVLGGSTEAQRQLLESVASVAGETVASTLSSYLDSALRGADTAAVLGFGLLAWTASSLLLEVQHGLNDIFEVPQEKVAGMVGLVRRRIIGLLWAFGLGLVLVAVLVMNTVWRLLEGLLPESLDTLHRIVSYLSPLVSLAIIPVLFVLTFQTLTAIRVPWRAVWWGGSFTSAAFVAASYGAGLYFELTSGPTALGFAGSFVVVIFLAYLLSSVFLFGAELTKVYADRISG